LDALSISHNCIKLIFLVLEEDRASLTHHLSADYAGNCFFCFYVSGALLAGCGGFLKQRRNPNPARQASLGSNSTSHMTATTPIKCLWR
jgi:hypothetical protein